MKVKMDYNSTKNQEIKGKIVAREVLACFSYEMDAIFKASAENHTDLPVFENVENMYYFDTENVIYAIENNADFEEIKALANNPDTYNRRMKTEGDVNVFLYSLEDDELEEVANELGIDIDDDINKPHEIFEWWIITEYFYRKLKEKGYPVLEFGNNCYWGRCCTGQAILLDCVISDICKELEILEGQKYDWSKTQTL